MTISTRIFLLLLSISITSCISPKLYNEMKAKKEACDRDNEDLKAQQLALTTRNQELTITVDDLKSQIKLLTTDTASMGNDLRNLRESYNTLNNSYQTLLKDGPNTASNTEATRQLIRDLQKTQENLLIKEDALKLREKMLQEKIDRLNSMSSELKTKDARLAELEQMLNRKDSIVRALRTKVANALVGFNDKGLSVEMKNGKVYVVLEERLLFASGSTVVGPKGTEALQELAKVLEKNPDINVLIEGHTDNVPMHGTGEIKDNWDLSVMRATSVVRIILTNGGVKPVRITPAGRSEYAPINVSNTPEGRSKNRRIEIILSPKLDEILKVLETN